MNDLSLIKTENFNSVSCNFYQNSSKEIFMTREQIGQALEYRNPRKAIKDIHMRHQKRLDKFSRRAQIDTSSGKQELVIYSTKGVYEIYRWSRQPKADEFIDFVWNVMEEIRKGKFSIEPIQLQCMKETNKTLKFIQSKALRDSIARQVLSKLYEIDITSEEINETVVDDSIKDFINSNCINEGKIKVGVLYEAYESWCRLSKLKPLSKINFGREIVLLGYEKLHTNAGRFWTGIKLREGE